MLISLLQDGFYPTTPTVKNIGLKSIWISVKTNDEEYSILKNRQYDLFIENDKKLILPYTGLRALQYPNHTLRPTQSSLKELVKNMKKASHVNEIVPKAYAYAAAFEKFEAEYDFIPLLQSSFNPMVVRKNLHVPIAILDPLLWKAQWRN